MIRSNGEVFKLRGDAVIFGRVCSKNPSKILWQERCNERIVKRCLKGVMPLVGVGTEVGI